MTGVYAIINLVDGKLYVGSSARSIAGRFAGHRKSLSVGKHHSPHLQRAWVKYGAANFEFAILEECLPEDCIEREQIWIDYYRSSESEHGYNVSPTAGSPLGVIHSEETRKTVSRALLGKKKSAEHSARIKLAKKLMSGATKTKMSLTARLRRPGYYAAMAQTMKGNKRGVGHVVSLETKQKISEALTLSHARRREQCDA